MEMGSNPVTSRPCARRPAFALTVLEMAWAPSSYGPLLRISCSTVKLRSYTTPSKKESWFHLARTGAPVVSRNLLDELKIADITARDSRLLGADRDLIPSLSITGKSGDARETAEIALDKLLVEMVTSNPAKTLRWTQEVGSIESGKFADLVLITKPQHSSAAGLPDSPYRNLIDATEEDVRLVLVDGEPLSGDVALMAALKPGDYEVVTSAGACFQKGIDVTNPAAPKGSETFAYMQQTLRDALNAMGGDNPPEGGGPADDSNTYSYLKSHISGASALTDDQFRQLLTFYFGLAPNGRSEER